MSAKWFSYRNGDCRIQDPIPVPVVKVSGGDGRMQSAATWFLVLASTCVAAPYLLGVQPRTRRERRYVAIAIAFLAWVLLLMASLRSK
jgi:hypothetical protein